MKFVLIFFLSLLPFLSIAQVVFDKTEYDFGRIYAEDPRYIDIHLKNNTDKEAYLLTVKKPDDIVYLVKNPLMSPDSSTVIRFQINKRTKGNFKYTIPVFTSDKNEATEIVLKGRIEEVARQDNNFTACPSFNQRPSDRNPLDFMLTVKTIDKETREELGRSQVAILQNGRAIGRWRTDRNGRLNIKIPLGVSYFYAIHDGYIPAELGEYVNFKNNLIVLELTKKKSEPQEEIVENTSPIVEDEEIVEETSAVEEREIVIDLDNTSPKEEPVDIQSIIVENQDVKEEVEEFIPPAFKELDPENFNEEYFNPINVTFVIDVSSSMNRYGRFDLLKYSLDELVKMLRPQDKVGLVAYSSNAYVLMDNTFGDQKEYISEQVENLKVSGHTDGGAGIKLGYKQAWKGRLNEGQNHLIIITDGGFNKSSGNYQKFIERNFRKKNITMSIVGVKSNQGDEDILREAAELGDGRLILIDNLYDAQTKLKQEIRLASFKYR